MICSQAIRVASGARVLPILACSTTCFSTKSSTNMNKPLPWNVHEESGAVDGHPRVIHEHIDLEIGRRGN
eukprot:9246-Lingulodinium_polyedra.AAC.1